MRPTTSIDDQAKTVGSGVTSLSGDTGGSAVTASTLGLTSTDLTGTQPLSSTSPPAFKFAVIWSSPLVLALLILLGVNAYLNSTKPLARIDPESLPAAHTWVWWATKEYLAMQPSPSVVLLGSSLVMHSISRLDADYLNKDLDYVHHHRSVYLENALMSSTQTHHSLIIGTNPTCFNFALPGGMVSDDYIVARALFSEKRKPKVVILGLSPRDFIDCGVHCAGATPAFRYLKRYTNIDDLVAISMPQIWQRLDYWLGEYIYLWGKKLDLQVWLTQTTKTVLQPLSQRLSAPTRLEDLDLERDLPVNLRSEVEEGMFIVKSHQPYSFEDNTAEYKKRYRSPNPSLFSIQTTFLNMLVQYCKNRDIRVVVVNMPLTPQNIALMPAGSYDRYLQVLKQTSHRHGCRFMDLNTDPNFTRSDFYDTSHMNSTGGKKFADALVHELAVHLH